MDSGDDSLGGLAVELPSHGHSIHSVSSTFMSDPETFTEHRSTLVSINEEKANKIFMYVNAISSSVAPFIC